MDDFLEIATALHTKSLTIFVGTGFSKYMTNGKAPSWLELLAKATMVIDKNNKLLNQLFHTNAENNVEKSKYDLPICAQILEVEYSRAKKSLKSQISAIIKESINDETIVMDKVEEIRLFFSKHSDINVITTNYDTIFSDYIAPQTSKIIIEGVTIPRINSGHNIYHIHGHVNRPESLVVTLNDYYNFQNNNNYFSRKFFTLLQETTVTILGYSLGDFNLNTILNEAKNSRQDSFRECDIYYIHRNNIDDLISKFYQTTYGIKVIGGCDINVFFEKIEEDYSRAEELTGSIDTLKNAMRGSDEYPKEYLRMYNALYDILHQANIIGVNSTDQSLQKVLIRILKTKIYLTQASGAWNQYAHLADWLIEIASKLIIRDSPIEQDFIDIVKHSLSYASKRQYLGYSWESWEIWNTQWGNMKVDNQKLIKELIDKGTWSSYCEIDKIVPSEI